MPRFAFLILLLLVASSGWAAGPHDPALSWRTITSPRFRVHYPDGGRNLAIRVSRIAETEIDRVGDLFGYVPDYPIEIVIQDAFDTANGSAQVMPKNIIHVRLAAPTELTGLSSYDDWLRILLIHELAHICDIDQAPGLPGFLSAVFGSYVRMNSYTPQFLTEGVAVWAETVLTSTGRGRSSYVDMILRTAALDDAFLRIDQANLMYSDWPARTGAYFYGGMFHLWLSEQFGLDSVAELHRTYAATPIPYVYWFGAESVFGDSLPDLWDRWAAEVRAEAEVTRDRVEAGGATESTRLTFHGRNLTGTRYSPDGSFIIYSRSSPVDGATVRRVSPDGSDDRAIVLETYSPRFSFSPDGGSLYFSQSALTERFNRFNDIFRYDIAEDSATRLFDAADPDRSLRARDPDVSPDGTRVAFVRNALHQSWVSIGTFRPDDPASLDIETLIAPYGDSQYASPRFSPDGKRLAVSAWLPGGDRDILVVDAFDGTLVRRVTADPAQDGNPAWSPDGAYLLWESDASGISNIMAFAWDSGAYFQVTNVVGGAFQPDVSPDGSTLLFRDASGIGFDIHSMPFDPGQWSAVRYEPGGGYHVLENEQSAPAPKLPLPHPDWGRGQPRSHEPAAPLRGQETDTAYVPESLIPLSDNWVLLPAVFFQGDDPSFQLSTFVRDTLGEHQASLTVGSSWYTARPSWAVSYINDTWYPTFSVAYGEQHDSFSTSGPERVGRTVTTATAGVFYPLTLRHRVGLTWAHQRRVAFDELSGRLLGLDRPRNFGWLQFGYAYANVRGYPYSVSLEEGGAVALAGRWYNRGLGGDFDELLLTFDGRGYINNPWADNHVLALRLVTALAFGPEFQERFALGGAGSSSFFAVSAAQSFPLRGFPLDLQRYRASAGVIAAYAEYRLPLWHIERGLWTVPVYLERLHGAVFTEAGTLFGNGEERDIGDVLDKLWRRARGGRWSVGLELRADLSLGWRFGLQLRAGLALPLVDKGKFPAAVRSQLGQTLGFELVPYFALGSPF